MNIDLLKDRQIIDERNLFCRIQISYSELGKMLRIASGMTATAGVDGVVGIYDSTIVCYELALFSAKPTNEVFRIPFEKIQSIDYRKGLLGLNYQLIVSDGNRRYKLVGTMGKKLLLEEIFNTVKNYELGRN